MKKLKAELSEEQIKEKVSRAPPWCRAIEADESSVQLYAIIDQALAMAKAKEKEDGMVILERGVGRSPS